MVDLEYFAKNFEPFFLGGIIHTPEHTEIAIEKNSLLQAVAHLLRIDFILKNITSDKGIVSYRFASNLNAEKTTLLTITVESKGQALDTISSKIPEALNWEFDIYGREETVFLGNTLIDRALSGLTAKIEEKGRLKSYCELIGLISFDE